MSLTKLTSYLMSYLKLKGTEDLPKARKLTDGNVNSDQIGAGEVALGLKALLKRT